MGLGRDRFFFESMRYVALCRLVKLDLFRKLNLSGLL